MQAGGVPKITAAVNTGRCGRSCGTEIQTERLHGKNSPLHRAARRIPPAHCGEKGIQCDGSRRPLCRNDQRSRTLLPLAQSKTCLPETHTTGATSEWNDQPGQQSRKLSSMRPASVGCPAFPTWRVHLQYFTSGKDLFYLSRRRFR